MNVTFAETGLVLSFARVVHHWGDVAVIVGGVIVLAVLAILGRDLMPYIQARASGAKVTFAELIGMRLRKADVREVIFCFIRVTKAGVPVSLSELETHYLAGGRVAQVVTALIGAKSGRIHLDWSTACAIDRAGRDVVDAMQKAVIPFEYRIPEPRSGESAITVRCADGSTVRVTCTLTLRTRLNRLIGGANERMLGERAEAALRKIALTAPSRDDLLSNSDYLAAAVLDLVSDKDAAYEIVELRVLPA